MPRPKGDPGRSYSGTTKGETSIFKNGMGCTRETVSQRRSGSHGGKIGDSGGLGFGKKGQSGELDDHTTRRARIERQQRNIVTADA